MEKAVEEKLAKSPAMQNDDEEPEPVAETPRTKAKKKKEKCLVF